MGGVFQSDTPSNHPFSISGSIVAGNTMSGAGGADLMPDPDSTLTINYSLIGVAPAGIVGIGNITGLAALLGPLADNGGPTMTHSLMPGSPAIDAGDPGFIPPPDFDQRGAPFSRVIGGRVDMGALEVQAASADFDGDGFITGLDFLLWQIGFGTAAPNATKADGDADNDLDADGADLSVWELQYGGPAPLVAFTLESAAAEFSTAADPEPVANVASLPKHSVSSADLIDLALAAHLANELIGTSDDTEVATPSLSFVDSSIEPVLWSDGATSSALSTQASTELAAQEPSTTELSPWEDALDEAFASVFA
jgi:hypothetical protein